MTKRTPKACAVVFVHSGSGVANQNKWHSKLIDKNQWTRSNPFPSFIPFLSEKINCLLVSPTIPLSPPHPFDYVLFSPPWRNLPHHKFTVLIFRCMTALLNEKFSFMSFSPAVNSARNDMTESVNYSTPHKDT